MPTDVIVSQSGPIARIRFEATNEIHILSKDTRHQLLEAVQRLDADKNCRVIIFEAQGRTFLAGADLSELQGLHQDSAIWFAEAGQKLMNEIAKARPLTVCAIQAACVGGGCELALACDFRLGASATRMGLPETSLGLLPGWGGTVRTTALFGAAVARRIILTAELLSAEKAKSLGLLDEVYSDEGFRAGVDEFVRQLLSRGPDAVQRAKRLIIQLTKAGLKKALAREAREFAECYASGEPLEGIEAFRQKRSPQWMEIKSTDSALTPPPDSTEATNEQDTAIPRKAEKAKRPRKPKAE